jgi:hypothetical protein
MPMRAHHRKFAIRLTPIDPRPPAGSGRQIRGLNKKILRRIL